MRPLLLDFVINNQTDVKSQYGYDNELNLNVIQIEGSKQPFINSSINSLEVHTKTKMKEDIEEDCIELMTKTRIDNDTEDEDFLNL